VVGALLPVLVLGARGCVRGGQGPLPPYAGACTRAARTLSDTDRARGDVRSLTLPRPALNASQRSLMARRHSALFGPSPLRAGGRRHRRFPRTAPAHAAAFGPTHRPH